ncbi:uncharacterized protein J8A68_004989 [[Candida] subhashii]|uniref:Bacterial surface antigen (D15) domain-containing protein n=1 Tax=[Candida] subhashii TaxID=561895 RepID=A0A8J5QHL8_9ASCO|nr:uncharacterized protein J8A68_004989 [[Candida] subhashii]KAG7661530.1 hypothetical protein J8A68_004989 [[Candida] subhashii]
MDSNPNLKSKLQTQHILEESGSHPIFLTRVEVNGGEQFSDTFFEKLLTPLFEHGDYTLTQLVDCIHQSEARLIKTGVFSDISARLQPDFYSNIPAYIKKYNKEKSLRTKVVFNLESINLNSIDGFLNFNTEDYLNIKLNYLDNNVNQNAELLNIGVDYNPYKPNDHLIANAKILSTLKNPAYKLMLDISHVQQNNQIWQKANEGVTGGILGVLYNHSDKLNIFSGVSLYNRSVYDIDESSASDDLKSFNGDYLKSSLVNQISLNKLNYLNPITKNFPSGGYDLTLNNEISSNQEQKNSINHGEFIKSALSYNYYKSLFNNYITTRIQADMGAIFPMDSNKITVHSSDKFYLGGYNSFSGFTRNSIQPQGGLQFYKLQGTIYSKIPKFLYQPPSHIPSDDQNPLRFYADGIIGNVSNNIMDDDSGAISGGVGLKYFSNWANLDIGYYVSQRVKSDNNIGIKDGLQFSISIGSSLRTS